MLKLLVTVVYWDVEYHDAKWVIIYGQPLVCIAVINDCFSTVSLGTHTVQWDDYSKLTNLNTLVTLLLVYYYLIVLRSQQIPIKLPQCECISRQDEMPVEDHVPATCYHLDVVFRTVVLHPGMWPCSYIVSDHNTNSAAISPNPCPHLLSHWIDWDSIIHIMPVLICGVPKHIHTLWNLISATCDSCLSLCSRATLSKRYLTIPSI